MFLRFHVYMSVNIFDGSAENKLIENDVQVWCRLNNGFWDYDDDDDDGKSNELEIVIKLFNI